MADSGSFQFNDIELNISPEQIITDRKSINNFWKTLRTRSSIKTQSSMATLDVLLQNIRFTDSPGEDGRTGFEKLTDVVSQIRVVPFAWVENAFLRNSILSGDRKQAMVFAVRSIEIRKTSHEGDINIIEADIFMHWFNYAPFSKNFTFKSDIWEPREVTNPKSSEAWKLLYKAEQSRKIGQQDLYTPIKALGIKPNNLKFTEFSQISVKNYKRLSKEIGALKKLKEELIQRSGPSEFPSLNKNINSILTNALDGDAAHAKILSQEIFGTTTTMTSDNQNLNRDPLQVVLEKLDKNISNETSSKYAIVASKNSWKVTSLKSGKPLVIPSSLDQRKTNAKNESTFKEDDILIAERDRIFNIENHGLLLTGVSISFSNQLAIIPMLGHPYPTFQHIGGYDARIELSMVATKESSIRSLSNFYRIYEQQAFKNRQVPAGQRNIVIQNDIINACGVKEVINEQLTIDTVPGQPGTYAISMQLIDNPISSTTAEKILPGQSFTTNSSIRELIAKVLEDNIKIDNSLLEVTKEKKFLNKLVDFASVDSKTINKLNKLVNSISGNNPDKNRVKLSSKAFASFIKPSIDNIGKSQPAFNPLSPGVFPVLYRYTGSVLPENIVFRQLCEQYANGMSLAYSKLLRGLQNSSSNPAEIGSDPIVGFSVLNNDDIIGIERLQTDLLPQLKKNTNIASAMSYNISKDEDLLKVAAEGDTRALFAGVRRATSLQALNQLNQTNKKSISSVALNDLKQQALASIDNVRNNTKAASVKTLNDVSIVIEKFLTQWQEFAAGFIDQIILTKLSLPQFEHVIEAINTPNLLSSGGAYQDFPLDEVISLLKQRSDQSAVESFQKILRKSDLSTKNLGISTLIGPDFYLFNPQTDTLDDLIESHQVRSAIEAITSSQGDKRLQAEASWFEGIYKDEMIGPDSYRNTKSFATNFIENDKQYFERDTPSVKALKNEYIRLASSTTDPFAPDDLQGDLPSCIGNASPIVLPPIVSGGEQDRWNSVVNTDDKQITLTSQNYNAEAQHRLGLHSITDLPADRYRVPLPSDSDKIPNFVWPVDNISNTEMSSYFGQIRNGISKTAHNGIDIVRKKSARVNKSSEGAKILAAADGKIIGITSRITARTDIGAKFVNGKVQTFGELKAQKLKISYKEFLKRTKLKLKDPQFINYNTKIAEQSAINTVIMKLQHKNGFTTVYKHLLWDEGLQQLSDVYHGRVHLSDELREQTITFKTGDEIARLGNTGYSSGAHLHFQIQFTNQNFDPCDFLDHPSCIALGKGPDRRGKLQSPPTSIDSQNESLLTRSIDQLVKDGNNGQGFGMIRAFPAFKLYFIESDLGDRKHYGFDDFFSYSSVNDITVIRNRKIAADLCIIELTNVSGVLTNRRFQNDANPNNPRDEQENEIDEENRIKTNTAKENPIASMMLQPGTEIQLRLGYNNNPEELEKVFNGLITDIQYIDQGADLIRITCQSFGVELVGTIQGHVKSFGGWLRNGSMTSELVEQLMAFPELAHFGRWEGGKAKQSFRGTLKNEYSRIPNPSDDNIFAPTGTNGLFGLWDSTPEYKMYKTTIWDVIQEMTLKHPSYIAYPVPYEGKWGSRMTMFFGVPDQLYFARDPSHREDSLKETLKEFLNGSLDRLDPRLREIDTIMDGSSNLRHIVEDVNASLQTQGGKLDDNQREAWLNKILKNIAKDKGIIRPFRNYHVITGSMHIIRNNITSSSYNTFNVATVQHSSFDPGIDEDTAQVTFGNLNTFSLKVDAGLRDEDQREMLAQYPNCVGHELAKRYALSLLWRSMKEGYSGSIIIIGNPKIKPYDICYIFDDYTDMFGPIEVEQVVHRFSHEQGFVTEITPDMVIHVNQASTMATSDAMGLISEQYLNKIGLRPVGAFFNAASSIQSAADTLSNAESAGDIAFGVAAGALAMFNAPFSIMATRYFNKGELSAGVEGSTTPLGMIGSMIFSKWITRTQMAHPLRYSPLVVQGKPMLGGIPSKTVDGGFIQGMGTWFKNTAAHGGTLIDDFDRENNVNNWIGRNSQGNFLKTILGRHNK